MFSIAGFTNIACKILNLAISEAEKLGYEDINTRHLLYALTGVKDSISSLILNDYISPFEIEQKIKKNNTKNTKKLNANDFTPLVQKILENAKKKANLHGISLAGSEHILLELLQEEENFGIIILREKNISIENLYIKCLSYNFNLHPQFFKQKAINPEISQFGTNLTQLAKSNKLDPLIGRKHELSRIIQILTRRKKNNPCLIGESGVGKTVVVEGLATKISKGFVPKSLQNKTIFSIDIALMLSGTKYRGDFEKRIKNTILDSSKKNNIIFFIDEIHTIIGAGAAEGAIDAANILKPKIEKGEIQIIGSTTIEEYSKYIEKDPALERRFQSVLINEPTKYQTIKILQGIKSKYENFHNVKITNSAIKTAVELSIRYIPDRYLPDKAIDLIDEASSRKKLSFSKKSNINSPSLKIMSKDIYKIISFWTNIPQNQLNMNEIHRLEKLESILNQQIFGQKKAIASLVNAIKRNKTGTSSPNKPIGNFLFVGASGVGKTELCKVLAKTFYGSEKNILKLDMSEYMESNSISKLLGSPPGYVGHNSPNPITNKLKRSPYLVVIFDEIEKAHPDVLNILLQVMDEGILTDSNNKKINFKNTIIILTSNIYTTKMQNTKTIGFSQNNKQNDNKILSQILKKTFKPEFLTRLDEVILFNNLSRNTLKNIVEKNLNELKKRLKNLNYYLEYSEELIEHILNINKNINSGAREIQNIIKTNVENFISDKILKKTIKKHFKYRLTTRKNQIIITPMLSNTILPKH